MKSKDKIVNKDLSILVGASINRNARSMVKAASVIESVRSLQITVQTDGRSFDETVWLTLETLWALDRILPRSNRTLEVPIQLAGEDGEVIRLSVKRKDLARMAQGEIPYDTFIPDYVQFN